MIYLKVKGTFQQINYVLGKYGPVKADVLTFPNEPQTYYLTINETNELTAKLIVDLSLANITMMRAIRRRNMQHLLQQYSY